MIQVARRYRFSASHRLHSSALSDEANARIYGKCNHPYGHGHDYILEVIARGEVDSETGFLVPIPELDRYVRRTVLDRYDHKYMNEEIAEFRTVVPTTENVAVDIDRELRAQWPFVPSLHRIRILETRRNTVELTKDEPDGKF